MLRILSLFPPFVVAILIWDTIISCLLIILSFLLVLWLHPFPYHLVSKYQPGNFFLSFQSSFSSDPLKFFCRMTIFIVISLPRKQSPERLSDLNKNWSYSVVEPEFNYRSSCLKALSFGPQFWMWLMWETIRRDITLKSPPDCFSKGYVIPFIVILL